MNHATLAVYALFFMTSSAGLISLFLTARLLRSKTVMFFLALSASYGLGMLVVIARFYIDNILAARDDGTPTRMLALSVVAILSQIMTYFFASRILVSLKPVGRLGSLHRWAAISLCYAIMLYGLASLTFGFLPRESAIRRGYATLSSSAGMILICCALVLVATCLLLARTRKIHSAERFLLRGWAIALLAFVPLSILEPLAESSLGFVAGTFHADFVFRFACDLVSITACIRAFRPEDSQQRSLRDIRVGDDTAARFGLTPREREMVPLIARGLANKEIAAELGISAATVRAHIYNLFQKVGARSRIELLNALEP